MAVTVDVIVILALTVALNEVMTGAVTVAAVVIDDLLAAVTVAVTEVTIVNITVAAVVIAVLLAAVTLAVTEVTIVNIIYQTWTPLQQRFCSLAKHISHFKGFYKM